MLDFSRVRKVGRIRELDNLTVCLVYLVDNSRSGGYQIQVIFPLQALLYDLQMQKSQEAAAETKAQGNRGLRLKLQGRVI